MRPFITLRGGLYRLLWLPITLAEVITSVTSRMPMPASCSRVYLSLVTRILTRDIILGVAAYILSPLWPFPAAIVVAVDDLDPTIVDLRDYSLPTALLDGKPSVPSKVVWGLGDLKNEEHVLTIRASHDSDYAAVDGLM